MEVREDRECGTEEQGILNIEFEVSFLRHFFCVQINGLNSKIESSSPTKINFTIDDKGYVKRPW